MNTQESTSHPGAFIREKIIPKGMTVTEAARLVGVGRPALSNLLNGNAALSPDMATRIEKAFGYPRKELLEMQATYDAAQTMAKGTPSDTKAYVPPFLGIRASQITQWADQNISARTRLSVLLRTLVHSTGRSLTKVDFPGNDDAERPGWDGVIEAGEGTPWIPAGRSGWEFGTNADPKKKADKDFDKSVQASQEQDRKETVFIFVTPRKWQGKEAWAEAAQKKGLWKDVRAYDASDLEQWLEQSIAAQAWFANEAQLPEQDVYTLDKCWKDWSEVSTPPLAPSLFASAIETARRLIISILSKPSDRPIAISADSTEEALAFLSQLFSENGEEDLASYRDRVLVFAKAGVLPKLAEGVPTFIPVAFSREVERELAIYAKSMHCIVIYPRNAANLEPHIVLEPVPFDTFNKSLEKMGKSRDDIARLANESGRSPTILRRRLSTVPAVKSPKWATDQHIAESLIPFLFVGSWNSGNESDKIALSLLSGDRSHDDLERVIQRLCQLNDSPVWSIGNYRGVISKIDLLYAISGFLTSEDLKRYFSIARLVLSEDDPALDLDDDKRWAATIYGKKREFSGAFREGISETLVLLAVNSHLFKGRLGIDTQQEANAVIRELLPRPLTIRVLEASNHDLPTYAEASPEVFLSIIETDLKSDEPATLGLLRPVEAGAIGLSPSRTGLLWALEGLSWNPETLPRAALILARLAEVEINDNWVNKPANSLASIFRSWMPQTAASPNARVSLLKTLTERFPPVAWKICMSQFGSYRQIGHYSHKPRWRSDGYGYGEPLKTMEPINFFIREVIEIALNWKAHSLRTLSDLIERLNDLSESDQNRVWTLVKVWAENTESGVDKAALREKIRVTVLSRRAARRSKESAQYALMTTQARSAYAALEPTDLLLKNGWLFQDNWIEESADEIEDAGATNYEEREERISIMRREAMREIFEKDGLPGLLSLTKNSKAAWQIGILAAQSLLTNEELADLIRMAFTQVIHCGNEVLSYKLMISGALYKTSDPASRKNLLKIVSNGLPEKDLARLYLLSPYCSDTWELVDTLGAEAQESYWADVPPDWIRSSDAENRESVVRLLKAKRPRAAFSCIRFHPENLDDQTLYSLMTEMLKDGNDQPDEYRLEHYYVEKAFEHIGKSSSITLEDKAWLEFAYLELLGESWGQSDRKRGYGIPNLEKFIETHPDIFVQAIAWAFKRNDGGTDPEAIRVAKERRQFMAERGYKLIGAIRRIPGYDDLGELKADRLAKWIGTVRQSAAMISRAEIADQCLGKLLANAPIGADEIWPCEPVRQVMEEVQSDSMMEGAQIAIYNSRGAHFRDEGGDQERALADKYRKWANALISSHPFVASKLLMRLANTYEREARQEDSNAQLRRRLR